MDNKDVINVGHKKIPQHIINKEKFFKKLGEWGIPFSKEYYFCKDEDIDCSGAGGNRLWRFDVAFADYKVAVEIEGGAFSGGRHTTGAGYQKDIEKYNSAQVLGWMVIRATTSMIVSDDFLVFLFDALTARRAIEEIKGEL